MRRGVDCQIAPYRARRRHTSLVLASLASLGGCDHMRHRHAGDPHLTEAAIAIPIHAGQTEAWQQALAELTGPRYDEYDRSRRRMGLTSQTTFLQRSPRGDLALVHLTGPDIYATFDTMARSQDPWDVKWRALTQDLHGLDFAEGPRCSRSSSRWSPPTRSSTSPRGRTCSRSRSPTRRSRPFARWPPSSAARGATRTSPRAARWASRARPRSSTLGDAKANRAELGRNFASLDRERFFVGCLLTVPVERYGPWSVGLWIEVATADFDAASRAWDDPATYPTLRFAGVVANDVRADLDLRVAPGCPVELLVPDPDAPPRVMAPAARDLAALLSTTCSRTAFEKCAVERGYL